MHVLYLSMPSMCHLLTNAKLLILGSNDHSNVSVHCNSVSSQIAYITQIMFINIPAMSPVAQRAYIVIYMMSATRVDWISLSVYIG